MMKNFSIFLLIVIIMSFSACSPKNNLSDTVEPDTEISADIPEKEDVSKAILEEGDTFTISGVVDYSDKPSDIGNEYCFIKGDVELEYYYDDIYGEKSKWSSDTFYTKGNDTKLLTDYVGQEVTISGIFSSESHGIPYITNISIISNKGEVQ